VALSSEEKKQFNNFDTKQQLSIDTSFRARLSAVVFSNEERFVCEVFEIFKEYLEAAGETLVGGAIGFYSEKGKTPTKSESVWVERSVRKRLESIEKEFPGYCEIGIKDLDPKVLSSLRMQMAVQSREILVRVLLALENFSQLSKQSRTKKGALNPYSIAKASSRIERVRMSDGNEYAVFPFPLIPAGRSINIASEDVDSNVKLEELLLAIFNRPEVQFYYFAIKDSPQTSIVDTALSENRLVYTSYEFGYYRNPKIYGDFIRVTSALRFELSELEKQAVDSGPEYIRLTLRLSEAQKRALEKEQIVNAIRNSESNTPINFKPRAAGFELDGQKTIKWLKRAWPKLLALLTRKSK